MKKTKSVKRRTYKEMFLDSLDNISGKEQKLISNSAMRTELNWSEDRYALIKQQLLDERKIIVGRGFGGSVGLAKRVGSKGLKVFISYCHTDEMLKDALLKHLEPLKRLDLVEVWHDRKIPAGDMWEQAISKNLEDADIIILLVSIDFINSKYCYDIELERAIERHDKKEAIVIPVILRNCMWQHTSFAKLMALPKDGKPVCSYPDHDDAFTEICNGVKSLAEQQLGNK